jgi:hypothetical protein
MINEEIKGKFKNFLKHPGTVAQVCNLSYLGGRDWRIVVQGKSRQKIRETPRISTNGWV